MSTAKVLLADDSQVSLAVVRHLLESSGYDVVAARDGLEAMDAVYREAPDVVLLDVMMPRMTGYQVCRMLKLDEQTNHIPVVMLTSMDQPSEQYWGPQTGADIYLSKGQPPAAALQAVVKALASRSQPSEGRSHGDSIRAPNPLDLLSRLNDVLDRKLYEATLLGEMSKLSWATTDLDRAAMEVMALFGKLIDFHLACMAIRGHGSSATESMWMVRLPVSAATLTTFEEGILAALGEGSRGSADRQGDLVLQAVAETFARNARPYDPGGALRRRGVGGGAALHDRSGCPGGGGEIQAASSGRGGAVENGEAERQRRHSRLPGLTDCGRPDPGEGGRRCSLSGQVEREESGLYGKAETGGNLNVRGNRAKDKLRAGEMVVGTHISVPSPTVAEICGLIGFDFVIIDLEHVLFNPETFADIVRAAENGGAVPIFRPAKNDPELMLPYLDAGAMGVWVPGVSTAEDARLAVEAVKYYPLGNRGMTGERAALWRLGPPANELVEELNRNTIVSVSIENQQGIDNVEAICEVEGVDVVGMGPADLSQALGYPGQTDHPVVQDTIASIIGRIRAAGKVAGITTKNAVSAKKYYDLGVRYTWTSVSALLAEAAKGYVNALRGFSS